MIFTVHACILHTDDVLSRGYVISMLTNIVMLGVSKLKYLFASRFFTAIGWLPN